ncbi:MAG: aldo/keto reductase [Sulfurovaceae bacterium]|nr:aldo/keto reductase [Sulfurovaceae bacterium]
MSSATHEKTLKYAKGFSQYKGFYAQHRNLLFSKLGLGTFRPEPYKEENYLFSFEEPLSKAILNGINHIDTASNYRYGQSEKEIGKVLASLSNKVDRKSLIIASKGGFIPLDFPFPSNPYAWIDEHIISSGLATKDDIELDQHCMTPDFLEWSCKRSLANLGIDKLDIYYLHNPEMHLIRLGQDTFYKNIYSIFERFETLADEGLFANYGVAVWNAFITDTIEHISLEKLVSIAREVGGQNHRFAYIQTPFNLAKTNIYTQETQSINGDKCTLIQAAHRLGIGVITSSSLLQMHLFKKSFAAEIGVVLDESMTLENDIQLALQFVRSTPGIVSSLFSTRWQDHVEQNCKIATISPAKNSKYDLLYRLPR